MNSKALRTYVGQLRDTVKRKEKLNVQKSIKSLPKKIKHREVNKKKIHFELWNGEQKAYSSETFGNMKVN